MFKILDGFKVCLICVIYVISERGNIFLDVFIGFEVGRLVYWFGMYRDLVILIFC